MPDALLETTNEGAVEWAREEMERHKQNSDRLTVSDV